MAVYSHQYKIKTLGNVLSGSLGMKSGQTFSTTTEQPTSFLTATQITAINTFLTAVNTLKTSLGDLSFIMIKPTST